MPIVRRVSLLTALVLAWAWAGSDRAPLTLTLMSEASAAPLRSEESGGGKGAYELSAVRVLSRVIIRVRENYVDPQRVKPREMLVAGLEAVEKTVPDVMVEPNQDSTRVKVVANGQVREFDLTPVNSLWGVTTVMREAFAFISKHMRPVEEARDVEYAAVNGMLQTLDPHSVFMKQDNYRDMKTATKGEFGGLGFVIQMREGVLTVVKVLPKTPAFRASIKKDDQITRIGEESTVNMDVNEAVSKLRGPVDTKVTITVNRKSWDKPQVMTLTRALITIESIQSKLLTRGIGYVRVKNFQGNTKRDLDVALEQLEEQAKAQGGLKGLVLDLRGNPGGLLEQAILVSDTFLSSGTIVSTVGLSDRLREEKKAHPDDRDDAWPIAVLVNAGSASASEIVAGALKNQDRAVIIGRQSFGKGSVQVIYDDFPDDAALKLTIAKYLTPGDLSIQEVGITPDIQLVPTLVSKERVDVFSPRKSMGEADLEHHFSNPANAQAAKKRDDVVLREKPSETLKYLKEEKEKKDKVAAVVKPEEKKDGKDAKAEKDAKKAPKNVLTDAEHTEEELDDQLDAESQDEVKEDFEVSFARDFLLQAPQLERRKMLAAGRAFVADKRRQEEERIAQAITGLGVDWTPGEQPKSPSLAATLKPSADKKVTAGETVQLELTVENRGTEPLRRLRGWTESENGYLDRREFLFGLLRPGEKRSWTTSVKLPRDLASRRDGVTVRFQDDTGVLPDTLATEIALVELPRPQFAYGYSIVDDCAACNGDGRAQVGESVGVVVDVTNVGTGKALDTFTSIRNATDANLFIEKGRYKLGELAVGETKTAYFHLELKKALKGESFAVRLAVYDEPLQEYMGDKLVVPIAPDAAAVTFEPHKAVVRLAEKTELLATAEPQSRVVGRLPKGAVLNAIAQGGALLRVEVEKDRFAFVKAADVRDAKGQKAAPAQVEWTPVRQPAQIALNVDTAQGGVVVDGERFALSSVVQDPKLIDVYVLVNDQKVLFRAHEPADGDKVKVSAEFALKEGNNLVTLVARQSQDFATRKSVVVRRRPQAVAQQGTIPAATP